MQLTFDRPEYLWFLFVLPFIVLLHFFWLRHTRRKAMQFANFRALKRVTGHKMITRNYTLLVLRMLTVAVMVLAVSGPVLWLEGVRNQNSYVLAIDISASMEAKDIDPTRIEAAKRYSQIFIDEAPGRTSFGLLSFSGVTFVEQTLTDDREKLSTALQDVKSTDAGGTDIPGAIISATNLLVGDENGRVVLLFTDGSNTLQTFASDSVTQAVEYAQSNHVTIHTIGLGSRSAPIGYLPSYYNISGVFDEPTLSLIANSTGGTYHHATNEAELRETFTKLSSSAERTMLPNETMGWLMIAAAALLLIE